MVLSLYRRCTLGLCPQLSSILVVEGRLTCGKFNVMRYNPVLNRKMQKNISGHWGMGMIGENFFEKVEIKLDPEMANMHATTNSYYTSGRHC